MSAASNGHKPTVSDMLDSLTGFEEIAIVKHFDRNIFGLLDTDHTMAGRALVFTAKAREGKEARHAKTEAMAMTLKQVDDYFADDENDEAMPDEPVTEAGKGGSKTV